MFVVRIFIGHVSGPSEVKPLLHEMPTYSYTPVTRADEILAIQQRLDDVLRGKVET